MSHIVVGCLVAVAWGSSLGRRRTIGIGMSIVSILDIGADGVADQCGVDGRWQVNQHNKSNTH